MGKPFRIVTPMTNARLHGWSLPKRHCIRALGLGLALIASAAVMATPPPAGSIIANTATATYVDSAAGFSVSLRSNTVNVQVQPVEACSVSAGQAISRAPGASFVLPHVLTDTGNTDESCALSLALASGSNYAPQSLEIIEDLQNSGSPAPGDPVITNGSDIHLSTGQSVNLLIVGNVPASALPGQTAALALTATSTLQKATSTANDQVTVAQGASLSLVKSASTEAPSPGSPLTYTLQASNQGDLAAPGTPITVDGTNLSLVLVYDAIPANTTLRNAVAANGAETLYHVLGNPVDDYSSSVPAGAVIDQIAFGTATLAPGGSLGGQFTVIVNANAAGSLVNTAYVEDQGPAGPQDVPSNTVTLPLPPLPGTIHFFPNGNYQSPVTQSGMGSNLFVQVDAAQCNTLPSQTQSYPVLLSAALSGDQETFTATETAPNSGVFRIMPDVPTADAASKPVVRGDGVLELLPNDVVTATLQGCTAAGSISTTILIDPQGVVFDSKTNQPVSGATVTLIDVTGSSNGGLAGRPATVFEPDGTTPAPNPVVTNGTGVFQFPVVKAGTYAVRIDPPTGYAFPSKLAPALLPANRTIEQPASYGGDFTMPSAAPIHFDVPLDAAATGPILVQKTASRSTASVGDFVDYTINVINRSGIELSSVILSDMLPQGFVFVHGSASMNGAHIPDPSSRSGMLGFTLGSLAKDQTDTLVYRVSITPGAQMGNAINTAFAQSGAMRSNVAAARVQVIGGAFTDKAVLIGKVYAACSPGKMQTQDDPGVPGVRIWLANGTYAITDESGKYSFYGLTPRTTVAAVDPSTLPAHTHLIVLDHRNAMDAGSQFVDLQDGELHKADFALGPCTAALRKVIAVRRKAERQPADIASLSRELLNPNALQSVAPNSNFLPASGRLSQEHLINGGSALNGAAANLGAVGDLGGPVTMHSPTSRPLAPSTEPSAGLAGTMRQAAIRDDQPSPSAILNHATPALAFVGLKEGSIAPTDQIRVRVKGAAGAILKLQVNGHPIPLARVGTRTVLASRGVELWEYIGIDLQPGANTLVAVEQDPFGNVRGRVAMRIRAPGPLAGFRILYPKRAVADATTPIPVTIEPVDATGLPILSRTPVTLSTDEGVWQAKDLNSTQAGVQQFIEGGRGVFDLLPPAHPSTAHVRVRSGTVATSANLTFEPDLRPLFGVGIIEGVLNINKLGGGAIQSTGSNDGFQREIQSLSLHFGNGDSAAARTQLFLKGKILGSTLLTLGYDSDKPSSTALFRDIQPDRYYPVYGDSSVKGFDAQSTGKLYVRLDNGTSYLLLGDFTTQSENSARQLTQYSRALNGIKGRLRRSNWQVTGFASHTPTQQVVLEIPSNGTSGPYFLNTNGVINSQQVDLITVDRNQPGVVISDKPLTPFVDYTIEPFTGELLFNAPVPMVDANLNPVLIRVSYEVDSGGPKHWVGGVDARRRLASWLSVGGTVIEDDNPSNHQSLDGVNATINTGSIGVLQAELAQSDTGQFGRGRAQRMEWILKSSAVQGRVWAVHTGSAFYNPSSLDSAGQSQYGARVGWRLGQHNRVAVEALRTSSPITSGSQTAASVAVEHDLGHNMKLTAGVRHASGVSQTAVGIAGSGLPQSTPVEFTSGFVRFDSPIPGISRADAWAQYEQALTESADVTSFGGTYAIDDSSKLYFRHESSNSLSGPYGLNPQVSQYTTIFGVRSDAFDHTQVFNEYRLGQGVDGRAAEDAIGLRHLWQIRRGLGVSASLARVHPLYGQVSDQSTAMTTGISYTASSIWKGSARLEHSTSPQTGTWLATGAAASQIDRSWTFLNRLLYSQIDNHGAGSGWQNLTQVQSGFAYRPTRSDTWNALGLIEYKRNQNSTLGAGQQLDQHAWILVTSLNVEPDALWMVTTRYSAEHLTDASNGINSTGWLQLAGARVTRDVGVRWDVGIQGYESWGMGQNQHAWGAQLGYLVERDLWLSFGYNVQGFNNPDLAGGAYTQRGLFLRLRFKFGGNLLDQASNATKLPTTPANAAAALWSDPNGAGEPHAP